MKVLLLGGGAREHALAAALTAAGAQVVAVALNQNPGLYRLATTFEVVDPRNTGTVTNIARREKVDFAVVGPEAPLAAGVPDALRAAEIPVVGPSQAGARIETSKRFCRELLAKYRIDASPKAIAVEHGDEVDQRVKEFAGPFVVKPVGLTSGKGVAVQGADFQTPEEGASIAKRLLAETGSGGVLLEERVDGEEFTLMAFVTDSGLYPMPLVKDYKRAGEGETGGQTGGMGSFTQRDHLLPFVSSGVRDRALEILRKTVEALRSEGIPYRGVLYGGFMLTASGPILLEFNARFGDPEGINVVSLYEPGNFAELLHGVAVGRVEPSLLQFRQRATVVKYLAPPGYGGHATPGGVLAIDEPAIERLGVQVRFGSVEGVGAGRVKLTPSRAVALVGEASAIHEAGERIEAALPFVTGPYVVRHDIASKEDLVKRTEHMRSLIVPGAKPSPLPLSVAPADAPPSSAGTSRQVLSTA